MAAAAAGNAPIGSSSTLLIEKGPSPGRKLLITAAGQGNITHSGSVPELLKRYNRKERFLRPALYGFSNKDVMDFFEKRQVPLVTEEGSGRVLPRSLKARDILNGLIGAVREKGVTFHWGDGAVSVEKTETGFRVNTKLHRFDCRRLVIATGGKSYPKTGSTGNGYAWAEDMGHRIIEPRPALTAVEADRFDLVHLAGLTFEDREIELYRLGKRVGKYRGNLLITHKGLSGPVIIDNSRDMLAGDELRINFTDRTPDQVREALTAGGSQKLSACLKELGIPRKLIPDLLDSLDSETTLSQLKKKDRNRLINRLSSYPVLLTRLQGWDGAMVTAGGVDTGEINPKTMESRLVPGLFFAGEVMDIDGDSGGFNLQAAFSTGYLAGKAAVG